MKILLISMVVVSLLTSSAFCEVKPEHGKSTDALKEAIKVSPSKDNLLLALPAISDNLTGGEVIVCSQKGNDGKYTLFYSSISGGATSEVLSGERETNTRKMFESVGGMKAGDWMGFDFKYQRNGKDVPMESHIFPVNESIICVLVWPTSGSSADISVGMDMAKVAPSTTATAAPLISPGAPMQQSQSNTAAPVNVAAPAQVQPTANQTMQPVASPAAGPALPPAAVIPPPAVSAVPPLFAPEASPAPANAAAAIADPKAGSAVVAPQNIPPAGTQVAAAAA